MLTKEQVLEQIKNKNGYQSETLDGRDFMRLCNFFEDEHLEVFGFEIGDSDGTRQIIEWSESNIRDQLARDVDFAFEKALNRRGLSAGLMHSVVKMWMWVLEDHDLHDKADEMYKHYGLPFLKAVAVKYSLDNPIGDDSGDEFKYSSESDVY